jgi:hypothetical protein
MVLRILAVDCFLLHTLKGVFYSLPFSFGSTCHARQRSKIDQLSNWIKREMEPRDRPFLEGFLGITE